MARFGRGTPCYNTHGSGPVRGRRAESPAEALQSCSSARFSLTRDADRSVTESRTRCGNAYTGQGRGALSRERAPVRVDVARARQTGLHGRAH